MPRIPLHDAAMRGDYEACLHEIASSSTDVNARDQTWYSYTALHFASEANSMPIVSLLLDAGADVMARSNGIEGTALHHAAWKGSGDVIELLVKRGICIDEKTNDGQTALHCASSKNMKDIIGLLLRFGAKINATDEARNTALQVAILAGATETARVLVENGASVFSLNASNESALHVACKYDRAEIVQLLLKSGFDVNCVLDNSMAPAHCCALYNSIDSARELLQANVDFSLKNKDGMTPLQLAEKKGNSEIIKIFEAEIGRRKLLSPKRSSFDLLSRFSRRGSSMPAIEKSELESRVYELEGKQHEMQHEINRLVSHNADLCTKNKSLEERLDLMSQRMEALIAGIQNCTVAVKQLVRQ